MANGSETVRAARLHEHGRPLTVDTVALPEPGVGEVRVSLQFGGVNPIDRSIALGRVNPDAPLPRTLGSEAAGELDGRPVLVSGEGLGAVRDGVWAPAAVVPRAAVHELPAGLDLRDAAAMGVAGLTAVNCVRHVAAVTAEDRVLVLGASGGVGTMIVSLARAAGATVWGQTGSPQKVAGVRQGGAERVVVGGPEQVAAEIADFAPTVAFDPLGDGFLAPLVEALAPRGRIVSLGVSAGAEVTFNIQLLYRKALSLLGYAGMLVRGEERRAGLQEAFAAVLSGDLTVRIDEVLPIDQINDAFRRLADRQVQGNLLLDLT